MNTNNFNLYLIHKDFFNPDFNVAKWNYNTEYNSNPFSSGFKNAINSATLDDKLYLPLKNPFIPSSFDLVSNVSSSNVPTVILDTEILRVWHHPDTKFKVPKAIGTFLIKSPFAYLTPKYRVMNELFLLLVEDDLTEFSYDAELAGLKYHLSSPREGVQIKISGYSDKFSVLLAKISHVLVHLNVSSDRFREIKQHFKENLLNWSFHQPSDHAAFYVSYLLQDNIWHNDEKLAVIDGNLN